ncbi:hypothetical protein ACLESD_32195, partial [Pyxidicoccus sp. 3LFB2]
PPRSCARWAPCERRSRGPASPVVSVAPFDGGREVRISDLRYHLRGEPTLGFVIRLDTDNRVTGARLERGGSASELLRRWRGGNDTAPGKESLLPPGP